jgi:GNAT superfamily N-acetyltransferase
MFICRDLEPVRRLLLKDEPATRAVYNKVFGLASSKPTWVRVDDLDNPKAVLVRMWWLTLWAKDRKAGRKILDQIPDRWTMNFCATPTWVMKHVTRNRKLRWSNPCYGYALTDPNKLRKFSVARVGTLSPEDSRTVAKYWPYYGGKGDSMYAKQRIRTGPTCAIRRRGELVAWALTHDDGSMGFLHVLEQHRGKGYARTIGTALAQRSMRRGVMPFVFIETKNRASQRLTESLGFDKLGPYSWFSAQRKTTPVRRA